MLSKIDLESMLSSSRLAVKCSDGKLEYNELLSLSVNIAKQILILKDNENISKVCILSDRNLGFYISILGTMLSGSLYTIIDSSQDFSRTLNKLDSYDYDIVIDLHGVLNNLEFDRARVITSASANELSTRDIEQLPDFRETCGYVLYTSGSTGKPKGVHVTFKNIEHYADSVAEHIHLEKGLSYGHVSSIEADLGNTSIFLALKTMGTLHIISHEVRTDPSSFAKYLCDNKLDCLKITPSHLNALIGELNTQSATMRPFKYLFSGGEVLKAGLAHKILNKNISERLFNHYGPTETTIGVLINEIDNISLERLTPDTALPIGKPFGQTQVMIRNAEGDHALGEELQGELLIGGPSVSNGYVNNEEQNDKCFVYIDQTRYYCTGDIVESDIEQNVRFRYRKDRQVKIDGNRVELGDLESQVNRQPKVESCYFNLISAGDRKALACAVESAELSQDQTEKVVSSTIERKFLPKLIIIFNKFPINANGKTDYEKINRELSIALNENRTAEGNLDIPSEFRKIEKIWSKYVLSQGKSIEDSFYELGGDSISAIQFISDLQRLNFDIAASDFMANPTLSGVISNLDKNKGSDDQFVTHDLTEFDLNYPIIEWFFSNIRSDRNQWTQSHLFESSKPLNTKLLQKSLEIVGKAHPIISTRVEYRASKPNKAVQSNKPGYFFTHTKLVSTSESEISRAIYYTSAVLQESINLEDGRILRIHYFQFAKKQLLLFICHHLFIDSVSWKTILSELIDIYDQLYLGNKVSLPGERVPFGAWSQSIRDNASLYLEDQQYWQGRDTTPTPNESFFSENIEANSETTWIRLSSSTSKQLRNIKLRGKSVSYDQIILTLALMLIKRDYNLEKSDIFVESYGRDSKFSNLDISRSVGWFTSMFPINADTQTDNIFELLLSVTGALNAVPNLGLAYGLRENHINHSSEKVNICYNFLGPIDHYHGEYIDLSSSFYSTAPCRGKTNERIFDVKVTTKQLNGETFIAFENKKHNFYDEQHDQISIDLRFYSKQLTGSDDIESSTVLQEETTSVGKMNYLPSSFFQENERKGSINYSQKEYRTAILTGVTGYIGAHLLHCILASTNMYVTCLVRAESDEHALIRVREAYKNYFGSQCNIDERRICCYASDISKKHFSLSQERYSNLLVEAECIYHFAADTRLFNDADISYKYNVLSTQNVIDFCDDSNICDLHFASTLAISGISPTEEAITYSELSFDVGQHFQNSYEETKFESEKLVRRFHNLGGNVKIYRYGNVSADSERSKFQSNSADNRFIQIVKGLIKGASRLDLLPKNIVLTPVDFVAKSTLLLSMLETNEFVFHVDYQKGISFTEIKQALMDMGYRISNPSSLYDASTTRDSDIILSDFWLLRDEKKIRFNNSRTLNILADHGIYEIALNKLWLINLFTHLQKDDVLPLVDYTEEKVS